MSILFQSLRDVLFYRILCNTYAYTKIFKCFALIVFSQVVS